MALDLKKCLEDPASVAASIDDVVPELKKVKLANESADQGYIDKTVVPELDKGLLTQAHYIVQMLQT